MGYRLFFIKNRRFAGCGSRWGGSGRDRWWAQWCRCRCCGKTPRGKGFDRRLRAVRGLGQAKPGGCICQQQAVSDHDSDHQQNQATAR